MIEFSTRKDIEAPQGFVFRAASDFTAFERQALRRGIDISRTSGAGPVGTDTTWVMKADWRDRHWAIDGQVEQFDPPTGYVVRGKTPGAAQVLTVELITLSRTVTRLSVTLSLVPHTLKMRLMVGSLRLMRRSIQHKMEQRVAIFAADVEDKYRAMA